MEDKEQSRRRIHMGFRARTSHFADHRQGRLHGLGVDSHPDRHHQHHDLYSCQPAHRQRFRDRHGHRRAGRQIQSHPGLAGRRRRGAVEKRRASEGGAGRYEVHFDTPIIIGPTPYDFVFQISAPGYAPEQSRAIKPNEGVVTWDVKLKKTPATIAQVKTADGKPAAGVKVFLAATRDYLQLDGTELSNQNQDSENYETDADGHFELPPQTGNFSLVAASPAGFALVSQSDFTNSLTLTLQPWGRVDGTLLNHGRPLPGRELYSLPATVRSSATCGTKTR